MCTPLCVELQQILILQWLSPISLMNSALRMVLTILTYASLSKTLSHINMNTDNQAEAMDVDEIAPTTTFSHYHYTIMESNESGDSSSSDDSSDNDENTEEQNVPMIQSVTATINAFIQHTTDTETVAANSGIPDEPAKRVRHVGPNLTENRNKQILDMLISKGLPVKRVAEYFQMSPKAVRKIKLKYRQNGNVIPKRKM